MTRGWRQILLGVTAEALASILGGLLLAWCSLLRKNTTQLERLRRYVADGNQVLAVFWHGKYFPLFALARGTNAVVLTTNSFRGHVIAGICKRFGYKPVLLPAEAGASGLSVMVQLFQGRPGLAALALDGPSGPNHQIRSGALQVSAHNGVKLVPIGIASRRKLLMTSRWDRQEIPLPFSAVALAVGEMIDLAGQPDPADLPAWQAIVQHGMDLAEQQAETILAGMDGGTGSS